MAPGVVSNAEIAPSLGRNLAACGTRTPCTATATVPLVAPGTLFDVRRVQLDLRLTKLVKLGAKLRLRGNFDVYNVLNAISVLALNTTYGSRWLQPVGNPNTGSAILDGRLFQFSGQVSF